MSLHIKVITPEKSLFDSTADSVTAPSTTGEITILPGHVSLVTQLDHGEIIIKNGSKESSITVAGGFLEVANNTVSVLADYAIASDDIQVAKAEEAKDRAEKLMKEKTSESDFAQAQSIFRRAVLELKIASKRKHHRSGPPIN